MCLSSAGAAAPAGDSRFPAETLRRQEGSHAGTVPAQCPGPVSLLLLLPLYLSSLLSVASNTLTLSCCIFTLATLSNSNHTIVTPPLPLEYRQPFISCDPLTSVQPPPPPISVNPDSLVPSLLCRVPSQSS